MKTGDLTKQFGVSAQTIHRWVIEFSDFLSDSGKGVGVRQKSFSADDFLVMATIHQLSLDGTAFTTIKERLQEGYRVESTVAASMGYEDGRLVPAAVVEQVIDSVEIRVELEQVKAERDKLVEMLEETREKLEAAETARRDEVKALNERLIELQRLLGQAEGELNIRREQDQKKRKWF